MPKIGDREEFPRLELKTIHGDLVAVPDAKTPWVHLQFRRFAGCAFCNMHLQKLIQNQSTIKAAGIHEVVIFQSSREVLLPHQGGFPFDIIADPEKILYQQFGIETSPLALLHPVALSNLVRAQMIPNRPKTIAENGTLGLPAEFLISQDGHVAKSHYGKHAYDQWSVDTLLRYASTQAV
ncbi:MAG: AhpC/TSA family protein [Cytophagaceae bacterium]|nr:MAG: AhpC/TSA family protein [Cytophagaceae bacterium]